MASSSTPRKRINKTSSAKNSKKKSKRQPLRREVKLFIAGFLLIVLIFSFYTPCFGIFGRILRNIGLAFFGAPGYAIPLYFAAMFFHALILGKIEPYRKVYVSIAVSGALVSAFLTVNYNAANNIIGYDYFNNTELLGFMIENGKNLIDGGLFGAVGVPLKVLFGATGSRLVIIFAIIILISATTKFEPIIKLAALISRLFAALRPKLEEAWQDARERMAALAEERELRRAEEEEEEAEEESNQQITADDILKQTSFEDSSDNARAAEEEKPRANRRGKKRVREIPAPEASEEKSAGIDIPNINIFIPNAEPADEDSADVGNVDFVPFNSEPTHISREEADLPPFEPVEEDLIEPDDESEQTEIVEVPEEPTGGVPEPESKRPKKSSVPNTPIDIDEDELIEETPPYVFPPITLLERSTSRAADSSAQSLRAQAAKLIETLKSFGVEAKILEVSKGPSVTRFEIQPSAGVKVSKITNLADDIALNLAAYSVRIEAPIPGKAAVGIEIPNVDNSIVHLREVIDTPEFKNFSAKTIFALGKDITGKPVITDIAKMPHALIAGATGSGKSVCINALIASIIYKADPSEVKLIMIDPKVVELSVYNGIPHLLIPVVTDPRKAAGALNWAVQEMTKRYKLFAENNVRDIKGYNSLATLNGENTLPHIIIIVDELADLMMVAPHDVEDAICRLAQLARAAGMHLVIATQRPSVDVITGLIKANVPSRIAFAVSSQIDSRTILDMGGAEKLLGKGDMLFLPMGASKPKRIQGAFISDAEVNRLVDFVKNPDVRYDEDVIEKIESGVSPEKEPDAKDADELLPQAVQIVVEANQASASLLQRRLKVGYSRAGRLIDQLEERGIIGPHEGAKPRAVLISKAEYAEMVMQGED